MAILAAAYVGLPVMMSNWWYLNCRLVPFLWAGLLRAACRARCPGRSRIALAACALSFSAVTGIDYLRLDRDRAEFTAGIDAVPERATLLPLMFKHSKTSDFTASLTHAWGYYTVAKNTLGAADLRGRALLPDHLPGVSAARADPARPRPVRRGRPAAPRQVCKLLRQFPDRRGMRRDLARPVVGLLAARRSRASATCSPGPFRPKSRPLIPARYRRVFAAGDLEIYARADSARAPELSPSEFVASRRRDPNIPPWE